MDRQRSYPIPATGGVSPLSSWRLPLMVQALHAWNWGRRSERTQTLSISIQSVVLFTPASFSAGLAKHEAFKRLEQAWYKPLGLSNDGFPGRIENLHVTPDHALCRCITDVNWGISWWKLAMGLLIYLRKGYSSKRFGKHILENWAPQ